MSHPQRRTRPGVAGPVETREGSLTTTTVDYGGAVVVSLAGELRDANATRARRVIDRASEACEGLVVLDLYDLELLDSGGCAMIAALAEDDAVASRLRVLPSTSLDVTRTLALRGRGALDGFRGGVGSLTDRRGDARA